MVVNLPCLKGPRSTCPYTECPLIFLTGSRPTERTTADYSSCLYFDFTNLSSPQRTGFSVDAFLCFDLLVFHCTDADL